MSPIVNGFLERIWDRLYDTVILSAGSEFSRTRLFCIPVGQHDGKRIRGFEHTNMIISGYLEHPQSFLANRMRIELLAAGESDLALFKQRVSVELHIAMKIYFRGPASALLLEDWIRKAVEEIGAKQAEDIKPYLDKALIAGNLGIAALGTDPIVIEPQCPFSVEIRCQDPWTLTHPFVFRLFLEGPKHRAVC